MASSINENQVSVMKEIHRLLIRAGKVFDGQVEIVFNDDNDNMVNDNNDESNNEVNNNNDNQGANNENDNSNDNSNVRFDFYITPKGGLYKGAKFMFKMSININEYPNKPPEVYCWSEIYHPNIDISGSGYGPRNICVNLLGSDWSPQVGLEGAIMAVLFLFYHPELDDALSTVCCDVDYCEYQHNVFLSLRGNPIEEFSFDKLIDDTDSVCPCDNCVNERINSSSKVIIDNSNIDSSDDTTMNQTQIDMTSGDTSFEPIPVELSINPVLDDALTNPSSINTSITLTPIDTTNDFNTTPRTQCNDDYQDNVEVSSLDPCCNKMNGVPRVNMWYAKFKEWFRGTRLFRITTVSKTC